MVFRICHNCQQFPCNNFVSYVPLRQHEGPKVNQWAFVAQRGFEAHKSAYLKAVRPGYFSPKSQLGASHSVQSLGWLSPESSITLAAVFNQCQCTGVANSLPVEEVVCSCLCLGHCSKFPSFLPVNRHTCLTSHGENIEGHPFWGHTVPSCTLSFNDPPPKLNPPFGLSRKKPSRDPI